MATALARDRRLAHLDLDSLAWSSPGVRRSVHESAREILEFVTQKPAWVIEGCYADLLQEALPFANELIFLNPGVEACVANCRARPWEPDKYPSKVAQDKMLEFLIAWVRDYEVRSDEYSLEAHRRLFEDFQGVKREVN